METERAGGLGTGEAWGTGRGGFVRRAAGRNGDGMGNLNIDYFLDFHLFGIFWISKSSKFKYF